MVGLRAFSSCIMRTYSHLSMGWRGPTLVAKLAIIPAKGTFGRLFMSTVIFSHRSAPRSQASPASNSPTFSSTQTYPTLNTGLARTGSSGSIFTLLSQVADLILSFPEHFSKMSYEENYYHPNLIVVQTMAL